MFENEENQELDKKEFVLDNAQESEAEENETFGDEKPDITTKGLEHDYSNEIIDKVIKFAINECLKYNPEIKASDNLVVSVYSILTEFYINNKPHVILEAPTGQGKSVIAFITHFCVTFINNAIFYKVDTVNKEKNKLAGSTHPTTYFLTSSKMLQEQLDKDFDRFNFRDYFSMLKGTANYLCTKLTNEQKTNIYYPDRFCMGMKTPEKQTLACFNECPYMVKRFEASEADGTVLNYAYFLRVMQGYRLYFDVRELTIADECHLLPDLILNSFNITLTAYNLNIIFKLFENIKYNFSSQSDLMDFVKELSMDSAELFRIFVNENPTFKDFQNYFEGFKNLIKKLGKLKTMNGTDSVFNEMFGKTIKRMMDEEENSDVTAYFKSLEQRPDDIFIQTDFVTTQPIGNSTFKIYKHQLNDMDESAMSRKYYTNNLNKGLYMSATIGNIDNFAKQLGLAPGEYAGLRLQSNFDFSNSPIFLVKSGYLNYKNFDDNIDKVLMDTLKICEELHKNDKGIIHTATFGICSKLKYMIQNNIIWVSDKERFLFYENTQEKEVAISLMRNYPNKAYVIVGPSLYEGLSLDDELGRFNIMIKVPYATMTPYLKKKLERFPNYYQDSTLEKIEQGIGRTNRHINDYSKVYLMDSMFEKFLYQAGANETTILNRLKKFNLFR